MTELDEGIYFASRERVEREMCRRASSGRAAAAHAELAAQYEALAVVFGVKPLTGAGTHGSRL